MMTVPEIFVLIVTIAAAIFLITERVRSDLIAMAVMVTLGLSGVITRQEVFAGFSGSAVITILGISMISISLHQTGATNRLGALMYRLAGQSEWRNMTVVILISAGLSLFMNNIAAVGVLLPAVLNLTRSSMVSPSRLMIPLAYGTILGGMATLLTTSNIIVSGALVDAGYMQYGLLDFLPVGIPIILVGTAYIVLAGRRQLPASSKSEIIRTQRLRMELTNLYQLRKNLVELEVLPQCPLSNQTIAQGRWAQHSGLNIIGLIRKGQMNLSPGPGAIILPGDRIMVQGEINAASLVDLGLRLVKNPVGTLDPIDESIVLSELVIGPHSDLIGHTLREVKFRERYNLYALAIWRENNPIQNGIADLRLKSGDAILVQGQAANIRILRDVKNLTLLEEDPDAVLMPHKQKLAIGITLLTLVIASFGVLPVSIVVMTGAVLLMLFRCLSMADVYSGIEWKAIFLIAGMWPLSTAIRSTGLADHIVDLLVRVPGASSSLVFAALIIALAFLLTQFMSGQVSALVLAPIALSAAQLIGVDPRSMGMAVALGCSLAFATPFGHPVNIMVMSPGGYTIKNYLKMGVPLTLLVFAIILVGLKFVWGL